MSIESEAPSGNRLTKLDDPTKLLEEWQRANLPPTFRAGTSELQEVDADYYNNELEIAEQLQSNYPNFAASVDDKNLAAEGIHIGGGMSATVHRIMRGDINYAVRTLGASHPEFRMPAVAANVLALVRSQGIVGAEQLVTFSATDGKIISHFIEGTPGHHLTANVLSDVDDNKLEQALTTLEQLQQAGVSIDGKRSNVIVGDHISYADLGAAERLPQTYAEKVDYLVNAIANGGLDTHPRATEADFADLAHEAGVRAALLERLRAITVRRYPDDANIAQGIAAEVNRAKQDRVNYTNPEYVAKAIAAYQAQKEKALAADKATQEFMASGESVITVPHDDYVG